METWRYTEEEAVPECNSVCEFILAAQCRNWEFLFMGRAVKAVEMNGYVTGVEMPVSV